MGNIVVATPNEAALISGCGKDTRVVVGACTCKWWMCETSRKLSLELIQLEVKTRDAETTRGVRVSVDGVCCLKVQAWVPESMVGRVPNIAQGAGNDDDLHRGENLVLNRPQVILAAQHFLDESEVNIKRTLESTMEGHQRQILGTLTVEELYKERSAFANRVKEHVTEDLYRMGFVLVSYTVQKIFDTDGYMEALGATQTALVKREAEEGTAKNEAEAKKAVSGYAADADIESARARADAHVQVTEQLRRQAEADLQLNMRKAEIDTEVSKARAIAEQSGNIEMEEQQKAVVRKQTEQKLEQSTIMVMVAEQETQRVATVARGEVLVAEQNAKKVEIDAEGEAKAELAGERNKAEGVKVCAAAEAERIERVAEAESNQIKITGEAEAAVMLAKGEAHAASVDAKAKAYAQMGEAGVVTDIIEKMPALAAAFAEPLSKTEKMVFISQDGSAGSRLTSDVIKMVAELPDAVEGITGVNLRNTLAKISEQGAIGAGEAQV